MKKVKSLEEIQAELEKINKETGLSKPTHSESVVSLRQGVPQAAPQIAPQASQSVEAPALEEASPVEILVGQLIDADTVLSEQEDILRNSLNTIGEMRDRIQNVLRDFGIDLSPATEEAINPHMNGVSDAEVQS